MGGLDLNAYAVDDMSFMDIMGASSDFALGAADGNNGGGRGARAGRGGAAGRGSVPPRPPTGPAAANPYRAPRQAGQSSKSTGAGAGGGHGT